MRKKGLWITLSLVNLCILALLGITLRTKFLFPVRFIDYRNFLSAHSHFAFGGWVTLALMILYIDNLLGPEQKQKRIYQWILWGIEITSLGMAISFPFHGYAFFSILFSSTFIFLTFGFVWVFLLDVRHAALQKPVLLLIVVALLSMVLSCVGPFTLAWIMATHKGNATLYRNAIYTYLHLQYNGFFILSVFALLFKRLGDIAVGLRRKIAQFAMILCLSIIPTLFLTLTWRVEYPFVHVLALIGCGLIILSLILFFRFVFNLDFQSLRSMPLVRILVIFSLISFIIKMVLQTGTIFPALKNAVFGYRPIIIGFLHLVFLGLISFYILSEFLAKGAFGKTNFSKVAVITFITAVLVNESILLVNGIGLMFQSTNPIYPWLLWGAAILLFIGAFLVFLARVKVARNSSA